MGLLDLMDQLDQKIVEARFHARLGQMAEYERATAEARMVLVQLRAQVEREPTGKFSKVAPGAGGEEEEGPRGEIAEDGSEDGSKGE